MERSDAQTHDFMNIESFPPLPFARRLPTEENSIRLFGKEFGGGGLVTLFTDDSSLAETTTSDHKETKENRETCRKFECNYCCRNFPTSQALGGHQNAHRRERLQAKKPHFQPFTIHQRSSTAQLHNIAYHHRQNLTTTASPPYQHQSTINSITNYSNNIGFYGGTSHQTPINRRPLALWRFPTAVHNSTTFNRGSLLSSSDAGSSSRNPYMLESQPNIRDQVSLELHL
ncbi:hypothetical protein L2E82_28580 [Cichorium intybus]|uniref:Uncharacterized protein n=1 Tax=Cichorium intybus TaxID=13427 RepID=A0ACB9CWF3_CICIN|nr:hypothetical protein L2E82_28580 [Cichorium intybus]